MEENKPAGLAIASMVLGIVSVLCCCFPFPGIIGLILGIVALVKVNEGTGGGKGMAIAGVVLNSISTLYAIFFIINFIITGMIPTDAFESMVDDMMLLPTLFIK